MKKEWNTPAILDLTIRATEHRGKGGKGDKGGRDHISGNYDDDICRCQGGISPCQNHIHIEPDTLS